MACRGSNCLSKYAIVTLVLLPGAGCSERLGGAARRRRDSAGVHDAASHGVVGFGFIIVGDTLRGGSVEYRIDDLTQNC